MRYRQVTWVMAFAAVGVLAYSASAAENWPHWRGPNANGISDATGLPTEWSLTENVVWKTDLPSWSAGTPIIWGDRVFITSASSPALDGADAQETDQPAGPQDRGGRGQRGRRGRGFGGGGGGGGGGRDPGGDRLLLLCLSKSSGDILWQKNLDTGNELKRKQNMSSPSPVTNGQHVWVVTGTGSVTCFTMDGEEVWKKNLQTTYGRFGLNWGYASSPILHEGNLVIQVLHGNNTDDPSYIVSWNALTGEENWRQERPTDALAESPDAYTTPVVLEQNGGEVIVISGGDYVTAHDPATGREVWRTAGLNPERSRTYRIISSPTVGGGMVYAPA
jgi:outer membrane protein assembly factor BamB